MATNIFICGVGGQGIGLMGDVLCHALVSAGETIMATETHGVAQRGGIVTTHIRFGPNVKTPKIGPGEAHFVFSLERLEGIRFALKMLRRNGVLVYYDAVHQPQSTRAAGKAYPENAALRQACQERGITVSAIQLLDLPQPQMQNVALLGRIASLHLLANISPDTVRAALKEILPPKVLELNLSVFDKGMRSSGAAATQTIHPAESPKDEFKSLRAFPVIAGA